MPPVFSNAVLLSGHVHSPGSMAWREGLRLLDVLPSMEHVKPNADLHYVLVRHETQDRKVTVVSTDLAQAWQEPASAANLALQPRDQVYVFDLEGGRARCETYTTNAARFPANAQGEVLLNVTGTRYLDVFERRDGEWRILEPRNTSTWAQNTIETATPPPPFTVGSPRQR